MKQSLIFLDSDLGRSNFSHLWDGIVLGASKGETKTDQTIRQNAKVQRELIKISMVAQNPDLRLRPPNARDLSPGGGSVTLEQGDIEHARKLVLCVPWPGHQDIAIADLLDFIGMALLAPETPPPASGE